MIAVTGANGLLGSAIIERLINDNHNFVALKRAGSNLDSLTHLSNKINYRDVNILDSTSLLDGLKDVQTVIHTAALVSFNPRRSKEIFNVNVEGTRNVVNACLTLKIPRLIHISSVAALGRQKGITDIDEGATWFDSPYNTDYAKSKYQAELELYRGQEEGLEISIINPSVILSRASWSRSSATLFKYVWEENKFYTSGTVNYVDVRDVVDMTIKVLSTKSNGRYIANGGSIASQKLFQEIARRFNKKPPVYLATPLLASIAVAWEALKSILNSTEPLVTKQTVKIASETFHFNNQKAINELNMKFRSLEETLNWCCEHYLADVSINKH